MKFGPVFWLSAFWATSTATLIDWDSQLRGNLLTKRAAAGLTIPLVYYPAQFSYYTELTIGSADDFARLRVSSDPFTWVAGPLPSENYCNGETTPNFALCIQANFSRTYDPESSTTFKNLTDPLILTSSDARYFVEGYYGQDSFTFGFTQVDNVPFGIGSNYTRTPQLGLGVGGSGSTQPSLPYVLLDQNITNILAYSIYLNDYDTGGSQLYIGAIDTAKYNGNLITFEAGDTTSITVNSLSYVMANGTANVARLLNANIEFSAGLLYFPDGPLEAITTDLNAYYDATYGGYLTSCDYRYADKTLQFDFRDINITIPASQWIIPAITVSGYQTTLTDGSPACIVLVESIKNYRIAVEAGYEAVLGAPFVRATYLVHDFTNQQTSFAPAKLNTTSSQVRVLDSDGVLAFLTTSTPSLSTASTRSSPTGSNPAATTTSIIDESGAGNKTPVGAIAGGVAGGVAVICLAFGVIFWRRRWRRMPMLDPGQFQTPRELERPSENMLLYTSEISGNPVSELSSKTVMRPVELPTPQSPLELPTEH